MKNRDKYKSFGDFVMNDDTFVLGFLMLIGKWGGAIIFTLLALLLLSVNIWAAIFVGFFAIMGWIGVYRFYKFGGMKAMPKKSAGEFVWGKKK